MNKKVKKVHGPYTRKDGRKHVVTVFEDGSKKTTSYPKWVKEQELGRELDILTKISTTRIEILQTIPLEIFRF